MTVMSMLSVPTLRVDLSALVSMGTVEMEQCVT